jgi:hypothetical protein
VSERYATGRSDRQHDIFENGKFWMTASTPEKARRIAAALNAQDNPELDDTPHESAAYARGRNYGFNAAVREVSKILDGKDSGTGVCSTEWQPTRKRLLALNAQAGVVDDEVAVERLAMHFNERHGALPWSELLNAARELWREDARAALAAVKGVGS